MFDIFQWANTIHHMWQMATVCGYPHRQPVQFIADVAWALLAQPVMTRAHLT
jgi:hypothetical protein